MTKTFRWTPEEARKYASQSVWDRDGDGWLDEVVEQMVANDCGVWHAGYLAALARYESGKTPTDTCAVCGVRSKAGSGDHAMCTARAERGLPITKLDIVDGLECGCSPCQKGPLPKVIV
jgi:hypothetical protein